MTFQIDIISDVVCPWCFIGKRNIEAALDQWRAKYPDEMPAVRWHPFQLNPDLPASGVPRKKYLENKFGGPERAREIYARVSAA
ncbi:MAG: DsbA family protein, partial [Betaproteobacteria bacterium]